MQNSNNIKSKCSKIVVVLLLLCFAKNIQANEDTVVVKLSATRAEQSFDPWGRYRNPNDWTYTNVRPPTGIIYRGFTGHEHLQNFDLINMNGRIYDSKLGLFLSIDPLMDKTL
ncbi:MAG: hypothetical protein JST67_05730 [Bacteroidetes bacterium]|nr:hypothetical protein [Bacteroidota bacterium]